MEALAHSRPTVTRALRELREADLVEQREDGYVPALTGTMAAEEYRRYERRSKSILSSEHLLAAIPEAYAPPPPPVALETLAELIGSCRRQGEEEQARDWCRRAREILLDAPDATAVQHRDWVDRHVDELEAE